MHYRNVLLGKLPVFLPIHGSNTWVVTQNFVVSLKHSCKIGRLSGRGPHCPPSPASHGDLITQLGCVRSQRYLHYQPSASGVCVTHAAVLPDGNLIFRGVKSRKA